MKRTPLLAIAAALTLTAATGAMAQQPTGRSGPSSERQAMREAHAKQRTDDLRTVLRLRPDQEPALSAFLEAGRRPKMDGRRGPPPQGETMTTPQRLDEMAQRDAERAAEGRRRVDALRTFYAALSPDQRQVFDALMRLQGPRGHGGMHGGRGGMHGPGG
jgi:Spy/CpxP family protein refolding chaperone